MDRKYDRNNPVSNSKKAHSTIAFVCAVVLSCGAFQASSPSIHAAAAETETEQETDNTCSFSDMYEAIEQKNVWLRKQEAQDLSNASKLYFSAWAGEQMVDPDPVRSLENTPMIGADLKTGALYIGTTLRELDDTDPQMYMDQEQIKELLAILEDEQVQSWKKDYSNIIDDLTQDGLSWNLAIGFADGAVEKHHGYGVLERNAPKNFSDLEEKLIAFAIDALQKNPQK